MDIVWFLLIGLAAGWLASQVMKGGSSSLVTDLIMGVIGSPGYDTLDASRTMACEAVAG